MNPPSVEDGMGTEWLDSGLLLKELTFPHLT